MMMRASALERLLTVEREARRSSMHGGFSIPAMSERAAAKDEAPFLVTNMRRTLLPTRLSVDGNVRFGFSECLPEQDGALLVELHRVLSELSLRSGWNNRCRGLSEAVERIRMLGSEPFHLVVGPDQLTEACGETVSVEDAEKMMLAQGFVVKVSGVKVLAGPLLPGTAMVTASPSQLGVYTRVDDRLGLLLKRVDRAVVLVGDGLA